MRWLPTHQNCMPDRWGQRAAVNRPSRHRWGQRSPVSVSSTGTWKRSSRLLPTFHNEGQQKATSVTLPSLVFFPMPEISKPLTRRTVSGLLKAIKLYYHTPAISAAIISQSAYFGVCVMRQTRSCGGHAWWCHLGKQEVSEAMKTGHNYTLSCSNRSKALGRRPMGMQVLWEFSLGLGEGWEMSIQTEKRVGKDAEF